MSGDKKHKEIKSKAIIFDMDGLLIDSEPLWHDAELEVFADVGLELTRPEIHQTMGMRPDAVVEYWYARRPWPDPAPKTVTEQLIDRLIELVQEQGKPQSGAHDAVDLMKASADVVALASSSHQRIIDAVLDVLNLADAFDITHSAEHEEYGKPHPGVYLTTARMLGVSPEQCVAIEDSPRGVISAKAAEMVCVAVPSADVVGDERFAIADCILEDLRDLRWECWVD